MVARPANNIRLPYIAEHILLIIKRTALIKSIS